MDFNNLGLSILELIIYEFWYDYVKLKDDEKAWFHCIHENRGYL